jgi:hypothetical protein
VAEAGERVYLWQSVSRYRLPDGCGRRLVAPAFAVAAAACAFVASAGASPAPRQALIQAEQKTVAARSVRVSLRETLTQGSQSIVLQMSGVQETERKAGSFVYDFSQLQPSLGRTDAILLGSKAYFHYGGLDPLRAREPKLKRWVVVNVRSALGVSLWGLGGSPVKTVDAIAGLHPVGEARDAGVPVVRYAGTLDIGKALTLVPQLQQLLAHLPSSSVVTHARGPVEFWVGSDGYLHRTSGSFSVPIAGQAPLRVGLVMSLGDFGAPVGAIVPPPASDVMTLAAFNRLMGVAAQGAASKLLDGIVLRASQVGSGYRMSQSPGGQVVQGATTLDLCGLAYPSESLRTARLQVVYRAPGKSLALSNEVVSYRPGGAAQALREVTHAVSTCPRGSVKTSTGAVTFRLQQLHDSRLLPGSLALVVHEAGTVNGKPRSVTGVAVYQAHGDILSGVYAFGGTVAQMRSFALDAAVWSAANLRLHG